MPPHLDDRTEHDAPRTHATWLRHLADARELVTVNLTRAFQRQELYYNFWRRDWWPKIGNIVWCRKHALSKKVDGLNAELSSKYLRPYRIGRIISPVVYDLKDWRGRWIRHIHAQDLNPGLGEDTSTDVD